MFGKKETSASLSAGSTTLVSKNTEIVGDINFSGNLMIEGKVTGNIYVSSGSDAHARVLEKGIVEGEIRVPSIVINGTVNGNVYSDKHVELAAKAVVNGNVHYNLIGNLVYSAESSSARLAKVSNNADTSPKLSVSAGASLGATVKS
jgi:cytoskeletal protein CcmA (bactofilin family)